MFDLLDIDEFLKQNPHLTSRFRFNTDWEDESDAKKVVAYRNQLEEYRTSPIDAEDNLYNSHENGLHGRRRLQENEIVFQFLPISSENQWLLVDVGIIKVVDWEIRHNPNTGKDYWVASHDTVELFRPFFNRLVVEKPADSPETGGKMRGWYFKNDDILRNVNVLELLPRSFFDTSTFNGYDKVNLAFKELKNALQESSWRDALRHINGVYLLVDDSNGRQYVGSAYGTDGIYGRWENYVNSRNHADESDSGENSGGNKRLVELGGAHIRENFRYLILEVFSQKVDKTTILERESWWKNALKTREYGYNAN